MPLLFSSRRIAPVGSCWLLTAWMVLFSLSATAQQIAFDNTIQEGMTVINTVKIVGWAKTPASSGNVQIAVDNVPLGKAAYPLSRVDVPNSSFILEFDSLPLPNGLRTITATSFDAQGVSLASASIKINIANTPSKGVIEIEDPGPRDPAVGDIGVTEKSLMKQLIGEFQGTRN